MRVLVAVASRHGATRQIAEEVARVLRERGLDAAAVDVGEARDVEAYDAIVLGSSVYAGSWLKEAARFVAAHKSALHSKPVWLFSSGPIGDPPKPDEAPDAPRRLGLTHAREHRVFEGKLDKAVLSLPETLIVSAVQAEEGDYRDWESIRGWAELIAEELYAA